jgi:penicillin-binding protein 1C
MLQDYGLEKFHFQLKKCGLAGINRSPKHYGLTLILGGAETSLWEITGAYASMSRVAAHYYPYDGKYDPREWRAPNYLWRSSDLDESKGRLTKTPPLFSAAACWSALDAMQEVERPDSEGNWEMYSSSRRVAWKTGTSLGFRDAWSVGTTPRYAVGVWVGNANGEGRPGLIGVEVAAPIMFDIFGLLPSETTWYDAPYDEMVPLPTCRNSGYRAGASCPVDSVWVPINGQKVKACTYHQVLHLSPDGQHQVTADCQPTDEMKHEAWFVVPPVEEFYFRPKHPEYQPPPQFRNDCNQSADRGGMQIVYPSGFTRIYIPTELDGTRGQVVFQVAHRHTDTEVYWHLDDEYVGATRHFHEMALSPPVGRHTLTVVDTKGYRLSQAFEIMEKPKG